MRQSERASSHLPPVNAHSICKGDEQPVHNRGDGKMGLRQLWQLLSQLDSLPFVAEQNLSGMKLTATDVGVLSSSRLQAHFTPFMQRYNEIQARAVAVTGLLCIRDAVLEIAKAVEALDACKLRPIQQLITVQRLTCYGL